MYELSTFADVKGVKRNFHIMEPMSDYEKKCEAQSSQVCGCSRNMPRGQNYYAAFLPNGTFCFDFGRYLCYISFCLYSLPHIVLICLLICYEEFSSS